MNLLCKFKYTIFLSSYFATLVLTKKGYCSTMTLLCKVKCTFLLNSNCTPFVFVKKKMCLQNCLPNCISHLAKSLSQTLVRKYTSNSLADLMVPPIIYINFPIFWLNPRPISNHQLNTLLYLHLGPIYLVVFKGSYYLRMRYPILRGASRLDAFSVYPFPT